MARIDWRVEGPAYSNCNCDYCCPCQFELLPSKGSCQGFEVLHVETGHFGGVKLDGLNAAMLYAWPGPIFEGKGEMQVVVDERANPAQRQALDTILNGGETDNEATHWWVYHAMSDRRHPTLYKPIEVEIDVDARKARASIPGILESTGRPIKSPATGQDHRVRIDMPNGIEFSLAEIGSASSTIKGAINLDLKDSYGQFHRLRMSGAGVIR